MNNSGNMEPRPARRCLSGLAFLGGMLALSFVQSAAQLNALGSIASLIGIVLVALLYWALEHDIPRGVDSISTQVAQLPEDIRMGLRDYLRGNDKD
ncbi:hypothetical protein [Burkholderia cepacia]|uniref:hypothetical protein n=1 Tax=Burkholderia cepacia TaxID=292 RepID=UPI00158EC265|nr:hypothetical protein [Burkholderia cepacia]